MLNLKDLWIGDEVLIVSTKTKGKFNGIDKEGKAIVLISDFPTQIDANDLELVIPPKKVNPAFNDLIPEEHNVKPVMFGGDQIDLHIEKLAPHMIGMLPARILSHQIDTCSKFIDSSIARKQGVIHIIHGKGKGILKSAVIQLLNANEHVQLYVAASQGGALDVWLK